MLPPVPGRPALSAYLRSTRATARSDESEHCGLVRWPPRPLAHDDRGQPRLRVRQEQTAPLVADLESRLLDRCSRLSRSAALTEPIDHLLKRWPSFTCFPGDGRICVFPAHHSERLHFFQALCRSGAIT